MARTITILIAALLIAATGLYVCVPRHADLRRFDPAGMARAETAMWRDYYAKSYFGLFYQLYGLPRAQYGFSPLDSARIALAAVKAAATFQPSKSREQALAALPSLVSYFSLLRPAAPAAFDIETMANLEISWWQARREAIGPQQYGVTIAQEAALTYGKSTDDSTLVEMGIARAQAMAYRDARGDAITDDDWENIEAQLLRAYQLLKTGIATD
jgi:hypothetical protein